MRIIGFRSKKLSSSQEVEAVFKAVEFRFGLGDFKFSLSAGESSEAAVAFSVEAGATKLRESDSLGFFRKDVVGVMIENKAHKDPYFVCPHSTVQIEAVENGSGPVLEMREWLALAEALIVTAQLEMAFVMGAAENIADYYRTPLGCGIGLPRVFWISCFGKEYSKLIASATGSSSFFEREVFGENCRAFVSAPSYEAYRSASSDLVASQRREIGDDLFNRLPAKESGKGESGWILNPMLIIQFVSFLWRQSREDWHRYQAKIVPSQYGRKR